MLIIMHKRSEKIPRFQLLFIIYYLLPITHHLLSVASLKENSVIAAELKFLSVQ